MGTGIVIVISLILAVIITNGAQQFFMKIMGADVMFFSMKKKLIAIIFITIMLTGIIAKTFGLVDNTDKKSPPQSSGVLMEQTGDLQGTTPEKRDIKPVENNYTMPEINDFEIDSELKATQVLTQAPTIPPTTVAQINKARQDFLNNGDGIYYAHVKTFDSDCLLCVVGSYYYSFIYVNGLGWYDVTCSSQYDDIKFDNRFRNYILDTKDVIDYTQNGPEYKTAWGENIDIPRFDGVFYMAYDNAIYAGVIESELWEIEWDADLYNYLVNMPVY